MTNRRSTLKLTILSLGLLTQVGCSLIPSEWIPADLPSFSLTSAETYTVQRGDTLSKIGARYGVTVAELIAWNELRSDLIEVDQVLVVSDPSAGGGLLAALLGEAPEQASGLIPGTAGSPVRSGGAARPGGSARARPAVAAAPGSAVAEPAPAAGQRIAIRRPTLSGVLGFELGGSSLEALSQSAADLERRELALDGNGLSGRSSALSTGGTIETIGAPERAFQVAAGPSIPDAPITPPRLSRPAAKRCLSGPSDVSGDAGMAASEGLSIAQINAAMGRISQQAVRCFPAGTSGSYTVLADVVAGCNGRVSSVGVTAPGVPAPVVGCLEQTLGYAAFPAHALPDGMAFQSPLKFTF